MTVASAPVMGGGGGGRRPNGPRARVTGVVRVPGPPSVSAGAASGTRRGTSREKWRGLPRTCM